VKPDFDVRAECRRTAVDASINIAQDKQSTVCVIIIGSSGKYWPWLKSAAPVYRKLDCDSCYSRLAQTNRPQAEKRALEPGSRL